MRHEGRQRERDEDDVRVVEELHRQIGRQRRRTS